MQGKSGKFSIFSKVKEEAISGEVRELIVAEYLVRCLEAEGVEYIMGIPGNEVNNVVIALKKSEKIEYILARDENNAVFMASGCMEMGKKSVTWRYPLLLQRRLPIR